MKKSVSTAPFLDFSTEAGNSSLVSTQNRRRARASSVPPAAPEFQSTVSEWLQVLGCACSRPDSSLPRLLDSFRNGTLLCELVGKLMQREVRAIVLPRHAADVEANFRSALLAIKKAGPPNFNSRYYKDWRDLASDEEDLWTFYWSLFNAYCDVLPLRLSSVRPALPYDVLAVSRLETSLVQWLRALGVAGGGSSLTELLPAICNGTLLAQTVSAALAVDLEGVFLQPKSEGAALSNIRKALGVLKRTPEMSQKFAWAHERDFLRGDLGTVMGLLEDLHRCCEGHPPRKGADYHADGPFLAAPKPPSFSGSTRISLECGDPLTTSLRRNRVDLAAFLTDLVPCKRASFAEELQVDPHLDSWLLQKQVPHAVVAALRGGHAEALRDGVLLCDLVGALERVAIEGVQQSPNSAAAARHNIRQAVTQLEKKPTFPKALCYIEEQLAQGVPKCWIRLLSAVRRLYPNSQCILHRRRSARRQTAC